MTAPLENSAQGGEGIIVVEPGDPKHPATTALLQQSQALMQALFDPEDNYFLDIEALCAHDIRFFIARRGAQVLGTGALALKAEYGEVKSMFVTPIARGCGVADALVLKLEDCARAEGLRVLRLETSLRLAAAVKLYTRHGFKECGIFGDYRPNDTSYFMEKVLA